MEPVLPAVCTTVCGSQRSWLDDCSPCYLHERSWPLPGVTHCLDMELICWLDQWGTFVETPAANVRHQSTPAVSHLQPMHWTNLQCLLWKRRPLFPCCDISSATSNGTPPQAPSVCVCFLVFTCWVVLSTVNISPCIGGGVGFPEL